MVEAKLSSSENEGLLALKKMRSFQPNNSTSTNRDNIIQTSNKETNLIASFGDSKW